MLNLNNTLDGYLKNVEVIGNTIQDTNNLANIRSVGDKVEGQELYKIELACYGDNILRPDFELGLWNVSNGTAQADSTAIRTKGFLRIRNQAHLVKRFDGKLGCQVILFDGNFKYLGQQSYAGGNYVRYDNILPNAKYMKINFLNTTDLNLQCVLFDRVPSNINGVEFVEFQESELEILSPVQLEKVGNVTDRIICKDGVWGVEKNILNKRIDKSQNISYITNYGNVYRYDVTGMHDIFVSNLTAQDIICDKYTPVIITTPNVEGIAKHGSNKTIQIQSKISDLQEFKNQLNINIKVKADTPQFIPLPHDQQVKLRTFAGQTNIAFLTEIPGQIKAQVPKSLGATVNTHTEQIADLHNSLDRVKKLEETTVSTIETERSFTTVNETSNGYFEDVRLEGRTFVNLSPVRNKTLINTNEGRIISFNPQMFKVGTEYTIAMKVGSVVDGVSTLHIQWEFADGTQKFNIIASDVSKLMNSDVIYKFKQGEFPSTLKRVFLSINISNPSSCTCEIKSCIVLEGDHTNNPPEYFEGLTSVGQDVEEFSVESTTKNVITTISNAHNVKPIYTYPHNSEIYPYLQYFTEVTSYVDCNNVFEFYHLEAGGLWINLGTFDKEEALKVLNRRIAECEGNLNTKPLLYFNPTTETWEKPVLREWDTIEKHSDGKYYYHKRSEEVVLNGSEKWVYATNEVGNEDFARCYTQQVPTAFNSSFICDKFSYGSVSMTKFYGEGIGTQGNTAINIKLYRTKLATQDLEGFKTWLKANPTTVVYQLAQEEVYECTNLDLMTYSGETNYIINSGAISPKSLLKVHNNISNVVKILQEKVSVLENMFINGLKSVLSGDMYSLATILYPEDFEQTDNTEQDIMVIPE